MRRARRSWLRALGIGTAGLLAVAGAAPSSIFQAVAGTAAKPAARQPNMLFILVDGWGLIIRSLLESYGGVG